MGAHSIYLGDGKKGGPDHEGYVKRRKINLTRYVQRHLSRDMERDPDILLEQINDLQGEMDAKMRVREGVLQDQVQIEMALKPVRKKWLQWWLMKFEKSSFPSALKHAREMVNCSEAREEFAAVGWTVADFEEWALAEMERLGLPKNRRQPRRKT